MRKVIFIILIQMIWPLLASAETYVSPFGFSINRPTHWLIVSREELAKDYSNLLSKTLHNLFKDDRLVQGVVNQVINGEYECYYNLTTGNEEFWDNIIVNRARQNLSTILKEECIGLSSAVSKAFGRKVEVYECGNKKIGNLVGLFEDFDGAVYGTRSFGIFFNNSRNEVVHIGGNCKNKTLRIFRSEFENIVGNLKIR